MHRSCPGVRFGAGAEDTGAPPGAGCRRLTSSVFLSSFLAVSRMSDIRLLPRLFIFPESEADAAFVFCFIELISSAALVFSFIELMSSPLENRPRNELPLVPPAASDGGTFCVPALFSSCQEKASRARQRATITSPATNLPGCSARITCCTCSEPAPPAPNCIVGDSDLSRFVRGS